MTITPKPSAQSALSRRRLFQLGGAAAVAAGGLARGADLAAAATPTMSKRPLSPAEARAAASFAMRISAARLEHERPVASHPTNGDELRYPSRLASYSKGLPHNGLGIVEPAAYAAFLAACQSGRFADFEALPLGGPTKLINPLAGMAFCLEGPDAQAVPIAVPSAFASAEIAAEMAENYWMALLRDVAFGDYETDALAAAAAADLSSLAGYRGPREGGAVTARVLFRGLTPGDLNGPYLSQFLVRPSPFGAEPMDRRMRTMIPGQDFMTSYGDWLAIQRGAAPPAEATYDPQPRIMRNGRDLGEWVHIDVLFQAYFQAFLTLLSIAMPYDAANPYRNANKMIGFGTLGDPYGASVLAGIARTALAVVWYTKWFVHRRLRPEAFGGRVHNHVTGAATYPLHADILNSPVLGEIHARQGTYLLPMAYPEGSPTHPAYGAGHATVAGACTTVLKAFFDESVELPQPVVPSTDGMSLEPYDGLPLTVGGELNKLASNVAIGRNIAGVHWRSDATESLKLGEEIAIRYLREEKLCLPEPMAGWSLTRFDGTTITV